MILVRRRLPFIILPNHHFKMEAAMAQSQTTRTSHDPQTTASPGNKPVDKFREGPVHVSIWENDGINGAFRTASFELRYKKDDQWLTGHSYGASDLKHLDNAANEARRRIETWLHRAGARQGPTPAA
jgi:hypothetical protein